MTNNEIIKRLQKVAAAKKVIEDDLGDGFVSEYKKGDTLSARIAQRTRELSKPMTFGDAAIDALPVALLCAGISGIGSAAISEGSLEAGLAGALAGGAGTFLINAIPNTGKRKMSVMEAYAKAQEELGKTASLQKRAYNFKDLKHPDNATINKVLGTTAGTAIGGGAGYGIASLAKADKAVKLLATIIGAGIGGVGGYYAGDALTDKWADLAAVKAAAGVMQNEAYALIKDAPLPTHPTTLTKAVQAYRDRLSRGPEKKFKSAAHDAGYNVKLNSDLTLGPDNRSIKYDVYGRPRKGFRNRD